jgi:hypothetical protein
MRISLHLIFLLAIQSISFGQSQNIKIIKDQRIDGLVSKQSTVIPPATSPQLSGYRIQLFFDNDRKLLDEARSKFISLYPKIDTYVIYNAPNYFLKVGDFRSMLEAERIKITVFREFPTCFITKELINLPRIDQD